MYNGVGAAYRRPPEENRQAKQGMAERAGFEPAMRQRRIPVFETGAFNHSATSPQEQPGRQAGNRRPRRPVTAYHIIPQTARVVIPPERLGIVNLYGFTQ